MKKFLILFFLLFVLINVNAQTNVSGGIYSNTIWTLANSPYVVTDTVVVFPGVTLTIQPGVVVKFANNKRLELRQATLNAQGTISDSITFTSNSLTPTNGIWSGIYFNQSHVSKFNYCNFCYAEKGVYPFYLWDTLIIKNSNFNYNIVGLGYTYYTYVIVDSCSFRHNVNGILGYTGYIKMTNSVICNNQNGIKDVENSTFYQCKIDSNSNIGIETYQGDTVMYCEIKYNGIGLGNVYPTTNTPSYISKNVIESNNIGIQLSGWYDQIHCNKICNNTAYDLKSITTMNINNLTNNYWCATDSMVVSSHIYDGYDNINLGIVNFMPIDTSQCYLTGCNLHVFATITNATCDTCHNGSATAHITNGLAPYTYTWNTTPLQTTQTAIGLAPGTYSLCVTDANGCNACNYNIIVQKDSNNISNCQAYFTHTYSPSGVTYLYLSDASYNLDSSQINVISSNYTVSFGGSVQSYPYLGYGIPLYGYTGNVAVCHTITTSSALGSCQSTWCDTIMVPPVVPDTCIAAFTYYQDPGTYIVHFYDQSTSTNGNINSWMWVVTKNAMIAFTSNLQHPTFTFQPNELYTVCLHIATDSGCTADLCQNIILQNLPCQIALGYNITHVSVINGSDGSIDLTVTGGIPPYSYLWNTGDTTQDISGLQVGDYYVTISTTSACPSYWYYYNILQPYDSGNIIVDTLYSGIIDTCLNFLPDSFYIASINVIGNSVIIEWVFTSGILSDTLYINYTFSYFGSQLVYLTIDCNGAKDLTTFMSYIYISQANNIPENNAEDQIKLYPNPVSDMLNVTFGDNRKKPKELKIYSSIGQQVYNETVASNADHLQIDVSDLSAGFYFVRIELGDGKPVIKKFIK